MIMAVVNFIVILFLITKWFLEMPPCKQYEWTTNWVGIGCLAWGVIMMAYQYNRVKRIDDIVNEKVRREILREMVKIKEGENGPGRED